MKVRCKKISEYRGFKGVGRRYILCLLALASPSMTDVPIIIRTLFKSLSWNGRIPVAPASFSSGLASVTDMLRMVVYGRELA